MLLNPYLNQPYLPKLSYWVGRFSMYDKEETLGEELNNYDPNDPMDRDLLIRRYCLRLLPRETFRHRRAEYGLLEQALADPDFDFASVWEDDEDEEDFTTTGPGQVIGQKSLTLEVYSRLLKTSPKRFGRKICGVPGCLLFRVAEKYLSVILEPTTGCST